MSLSNFGAFEGPQRFVAGRLPLDAKIFFTNMTQALDRMPEPDRYVGLKFVVRNRPADLNNLLGATVSASPQEFWFVGGTLNSNVQPYLPEIHEFDIIPHDNSLQSHMPIQSKIAQDISGAIYAHNNLSNSHQDIRDKISGHIASPHLAIGTTSNTAAAGDHNHTGVYAPYAHMSDSNAHDITNRISIAISQLNGTTLKIDGTSNLSIKEFIEDNLCEYEFDDTVLWAAVNQRALLEHTHELVNHDHSQTNGGYIPWAHISGKPDIPTQYTHPNYTARNNVLSNAAVISNVVVNEQGHVTDITTRNLTPENIGAAPLDHGDHGVITKQDILTPGPNIQISGNVISATDTIFNHPEGRHIPTNDGSMGQFLGNNNTWQNLPVASSTAPGIVQFGFGQEQAARGNHDHPAGPGHPVFGNPNNNPLTNAHVYDNIVVDNEGHVTSVPTSRILTPQNIAAATAAQGALADTALQPGDIYDWAKQPNKPIYTYSEVLAAPIAHGLHVNEIVPQMPGQVLKINATGQPSWQPPIEYIHPTDPGNRHIPTGGGTNQILRWHENGTARWDYEVDTNTITTVNGISGEVTIPQSDWNATFGHAVILNKPTLGTASAQNIEYFALSIHSDNNNIHVTENDKITWNEKQDALPSGGTQGQVLTRYGVNGFAWEDDKDTIKDIYEWAHRGDSTIIPAAKLPTPYEHPAYHNISFISGLVEALDNKSDIDHKHTYYILDTDYRLNDARNAADVQPWAKALEKPTYTYLEVGAAPHDHGRHVPENGNVGQFLGHDNHWKDLPEQIAPGDGILNISINGNILPYSFNANQDHNTTIPIQIPAGTFVSPNGKNTNIEVGGLKENTNINGWTFQQIFEAMLFEERGSTINRIDWNTSESEIDYGNNFSLNINKINYSGGTSSIKTVRVNDKEFTYTDQPIVISNIQENRVFNITVIDENGYQSNAWQIITNVAIMINVELHSEAEPIIHRIPINSSLDKPEDPIKNHYTFEGWLLNNTLVTWPKIFTDHSILEAKFEAIYFDLHIINTQGMSYSRSKILKSGDQFVLPIDLELDNTNTHDFIKWEGLPSGIITADVIITAQWISVFSVMFFSGWEGQDFIQLNRIRYGTPINNIEMPLKESINPRPMHRLPNENIWGELPTTVTSNLMFTLQWIRQVEVTFKKYESTTEEPILVKLVDEGTRFEDIPPPVDPNREGYTFIGWDEIEIVDSCRTIYGLWELNKYYITFKVPGQTDIIKEINWGELPIAPTILDTDSHTFGGWDPEIKIVTGPAVYNVIMNIRIYNVKFFLYDGGPELELNPLVTAEHGWVFGNVKITAPGRDGFNWDGWSIGDYFVITSNIEVYGKWTPEVGPAEYKFWRGNFIPQTQIAAGVSASAVFNLQELIDNRDNTRRRVTLMNNPNPVLHVPAHAVHNNAIINEDGSITSIWNAGGTTSYPETSRVENPAPGNIRWQETKDSLSADKSAGLPLTWNNQLGFYYFIHPTSFGEAHITRAGTSINHVWTRPNVMIDGVQYTVVYMTNVNTGNVDADDVVTFPN